jgi:hypothetical protein
VETHVVCVEDSRNRIRGRSFVDVRVNSSHSVAHLPPFHSIPSRLSPHTKTKCDYPTGPIKMVLDRSIVEEEKREEN